MKTKHDRCTRTLSFIAVLAVAGTAWAQAPRGEARDPAEWVPRDAVFYVGITDVQEVLADWEKTAAAQMMNDKAVTALPNMQFATGLIDDLKKRLAGMLDTSADQLKNPFAGPLAVYLHVPPGAKPEDMSGALVAGVGDAELMRKYYDGAVTRLKTYAKSHETQTIEGQPVDVIVTDPDKKGADTESPDLEEEDFGGFGASPFGGDPTAIVREAMNEIFSADNLPEKLALCLTPDRLIIADTPERVRAILRQERASDSLANHDDHKALLRHLKPNGNIRMLINIPQIVELVKAATDSSELEDLRTGLKMMGTDGLGSIVAQARIGKSSFDYKIDLLMLMKGNRTGLARILSMENRPTAPPATVAADTIFYGLCNLNISKLLDEIEAIIRQGDPADADEFVKAQEVELPSGVKFNWRKEFVDHLGGPLTFSMNYARPFTPNGMRMLLALGHRDQGALLRVISNPDITMMPLQGRDVRGTQVFDVPIPFMGTISLAVGSDRLMIGNGSGIERGIDAGTGDPLAETNQWKRLARLVPEQSWFQFYIDNNRFMDAVTDYVKNSDQLMSGGMPDIGGMMMMMIGQQMAEQMGGDMEKAAVLQKYSAPGMMTISTEEAGVLLTFVQLSPRE